MNPQSVDDTVKAQIVSVDLFAIIQASKEAQFAQYGKSEGYAFDKYQEALAKLREGKPQQRLQNDRLAREVARALLGADRPIAFEGRDAKYPSNGAFVFASYSDEEVTQRVYGLMNEDGLLDFTFYSCGSPNVFCFQTEMIYWQEERRIIGTDKVQRSDMCKYEKNPKVREAIATMLKPFQAEKPRYSVRQR